MYTLEMNGVPTRTNVSDSLPRGVHVVRVVDRLNVGGPTKHVVWLTETMSRNGFPTTLIAGTVSPDEGDMGGFARARGVNPLIVEEMSRELNPRDLIVVFKLLRHFLKLQPEIIHTHKAKAGAVGRTAAMLYKWLTPSALWLRPRTCSVVHTYHGHIFHSYYGPLRTRLFIAIERALAAWCTDKIITISEQQRREILHQFRIGRPEQFEVIPLGLNLEEVKNEPGRLRNELAIGKDDFVVGIVGRLCEVKNHALLLRAVAQLHREGADIRAVVIGDGHLRTSLESLARELGVSDRVSFTGFRDDVPSLYGDLDVVALTSLNEGTPLTLIEAMASGRAVASTEVGGVIDIMGQREKSREGFTLWHHGLTIPSQDAEALARGLRFLMQRPELRQSMGERGQAFVRSRLGVDRLVMDMERLYRELRAEVGGWRLEVSGVRSGLG